MTQNVQFRRIAVRTVYIIIHFFQLFQEKSDITQEKDALKDRLLKLEQEKLDVENERNKTIHNLHLTEANRDQLEDELRLTQRDKSEVR